MKPTVTITSAIGSGGTACLSGNTVTLSFGWTDPALTNDVYNYDVNWGDGSAHATAANATSPVTLTHTYGAGTFTITVNVNDAARWLLVDPRPRLCPTSTSRAASCSRSISAAQRSSFKIGSTIPVKLKITDCNGTAVTGLTLTVHLQKSDSSPEAVNEAVVASNPDPGTTMRFERGRVHLQPVDKAQPIQRWSGLDPGHLPAVGDDVTVCHSDDRGLHRHQEVASSQRSDAVVRLPLEAEGRNRKDPALLSCPAAAGEAGCCRAADTDG